MDTKNNTCILPELQQSLISVRIPKVNKPYVKPVSYLDLPLEAGQKLNLEPVNWEQFIDVLAKSNKNRSSRFTYADMVLEIMAPSAENEQLKALIANFIKILLESQNKSWEPFDAKTFKRDDLRVAAEPESCFYIQNYQQAIGKNTIDLSKDPAPDLALETQSISATRFSAYAALKISELWIYSEGKLKINVLMNGEYTNFQTSPTFDGVAVSRIIPQYVERAKIVGVAKVLKEFELLVNKNDF